MDNSINNGIYPCDNYAVKKETVLKIKLFEGIGEVLRINESGDNTNKVWVKFINIATEISQKLVYYLNQ